MKYIFLILILVAPIMLNAQIPPYGGYSSGITIPCTCPGNTLGHTWQMFTPLFFNIAPMAGAMVVPPAITFTHYTIRPASWALGRYTPGLGAACGIWVSATPPFCVFLPNLGLISPFSGSSLTGAPGAAAGL
jgi:hypothetical protein